MVASTWFFGTTQKMTTLRLPSTGMGRKRVGYSQDLQFENGGGDVYRPSTQTHFEYDVSYGLWEASGPSGLDVYSDIAAGLWGTPVVYFADPMYYDVNLFAPNFAAPGLAELGWKSIGGAAQALIPSYAATAANTLNQPIRTPTFTTTSLASGAMVPEGYGTQIIPIPTGMTLWLGVAGTFSGQGVIRVESWLNGAATPAASANLTMVGPTSTTRLNMSIAATAANYVRIGISNSGAGAGTISPTSMMAQLWPTGVTPTTTGNFQSGQGNNGCKFTTDALAETYILRDDFGRNVHYKGLAFGLKEIIR